MVIDKGEVCITTCILRVCADRLVEVHFSSLLSLQQTVEGSGDGSLSMCCRFSVTGQSEKLLTSGRRNAACLKEMHDYGWKGEKAAFFLAESCQE